MYVIEAEHILIERKNIVLENQFPIGQGQFGCVYKGILYSPELEYEREVAVKTMQNCKYYSLNLYIIKYK